MSDQCNSCRFWVFVEDGHDEQSPQPYGWGWCRRFPPTINDHMARIAIGAPDFRQQYDPHRLANPIAVRDACLRPSTFSDDWCGEFGRLA